jgi:hypothetical protein
MVASVTKSDFGQFEKAFVVLATTANQTAMEIDLSAYGTVTNHAGYFFLFIIATLNITPRARVDGIWTVHCMRGANNTLQIQRVGTIKAPTDNFVDFVVLSGNTLTVRIDGSTSPAEDTPVCIWCEGPMGECVPS